MNSERDIAARVAALPETIAAYREVILANLVMLGEIPAPTFHERERIDFLRQRFTESGLQNVSYDEVGNGAALLPGTEGGRNILVTAHADTPFPASVDHSLSLYPERVIGPAVADNSLGLSMIATLPMVLELLDIRLRSNLVLVGAVRSLGRGDLGGLRFFLANSGLPLDAAIAVEGVELGRLNYASMASIDAEIRCHVHSDSVGEGDSRSSAVYVLNRVIQRLCDLVPPQDLVLGAVEGGTAFKTQARSASLRMELHQASNRQLEELGHGIDALVEETAAETGAEVRFEIMARSNAGGLDPQHPLVQQARAIIEALGVEPSKGCCSSTASCFIDRGIPGLVIGITRGRHLNEADEEIAIEPIFKGVAQLVGVLLAIDGGCCDRH